MVDSFKDIYQTSQKYQVDMRLAAYMVGIRRPAEASRYRGWV
jgi:glutamate dehydrogenase